MARGGNLFVLLICLVLAMFLKCFFHDSSDCCCDTALFAALLADNFSAVTAALLEMCVGVLGDDLLDKTRSVLCPVGVSLEGSEA